MKKTLLMIAATLAAGVISTQAQVYSQNVVGYVNVVCPAGFSIIANPVDSGSNVLQNLFPSPANGTIIYKFTAGGYQANNYLNGWGSNGTNTLNPGEAAFIYCPTQTTNTFTGTVLTGSFTNSVRAGFSLVSSTVPISGYADTNLSLQPINGTIVYTYVGGYQAYNYLNGWTPPSLNVGQGFFIYSPVATNWVQSLVLTN